MIREFVRSHPHALATPRLLARNLRSAAAEARRKRRLLKRIRYRGRQLAFRIPVRVELHRRKEVRRIRIHHLFFWRCLLYTSPAENGNKSRFQWVVVLLLSIIADWKVER